MAANRKFDVFGRHDALFGKTMDQQSNSLLAVFFIKAIKQTIIDIPESDTQFVNTIA